MFSSNKANKAGVCALSCVLKRPRWTHRWLGRHRVICPFSREIIGGKLVTLTIVNLIANINYAKVPCCAVAIRY